MRFCGLAEPTGMYGGAPSVVSCLFNAREEGYSDGERPPLPGGFPALLPYSSVVSPHPWGVASQSCRMIPVAGCWNPSPAFLVSEREQELR